jgi:hypothetical protein
MDPRSVERLEDHIDEAIAEILVKRDLKKLPLLPSRQFMHLMANAIAVYEAVVEDHMPSSGDHNEHRAEP